MRELTWSVLVIAMVWCTRPPATHAQVSLEPQDTIALQIATMQILLDSLKVARDSVPRIWIGWYAQRDTKSGEIRKRLYLEEHHVRALQEAFSTLRMTAPSEELFLCPPGVTVRMPSIGCPIREDGVIVYLGPVEVKEDSILTRGSITRSVKSRYGSGEREGRDLTWNAGLWLYFVRSEAGLQFRGIRVRSAT